MTTAWQILDHELFFLTLQLFVSGARQLLGDTHALNSMVTTVGGVGNPWKCEQETQSQH